MDRQPSSESFKIAGGKISGAQPDENYFPEYSYEWIRIYQETAISTQNRGRLIVMLYDGAIKFLRQAVEDLKRGDLAAKGRHIGKAQDILFELNTVLDMEKGGQIAQNLRALYNFMQRHLTEANIRKDPKMIEEVIALLEELNQSWRAVCG